jgi:hypothetical protein
MLNKKWRLFLVGLIIAGAFMSLYLGWERHRMEQANRQVDIVLDWAQVKQLADRENLSEEELLKELHGNFSGVLFKEATLNDLIANGTVLVKTGTEMLWDMQGARGQGQLPVQNAEAGEIHQDWLYLIFSREEDMVRVASHLTHKFDGEDPRVVRYYLQTSQGTVPILGTSLTMKNLYNLGFGFDQEELNLVRSLGLNTIPQIRFWLDVSEKDLQVVFGQFQDMPVSAVFFNDNNLPGVGLPIPRQSEALSNLADRIKELGVPAGMVEFFPQKGLTTLANFMDKDLVRMHSIPENEMASMSQNRALDRYTLAVTDRNIRVILVRFFPEMGLKDTSLYLSELRTSLEDVYEVAQISRLVPYGLIKASDRGEVGKVFGLGVAGFVGSVLEIEAVVFPAAQEGKGRIRFNETAGSMAKDSVFNATSVYRKMCDQDLTAYDVHVNVVGGGNIDGPSAGVAIFSSIYSAVQGRPIRQDVAVTGELSIQGKIKPVGGICEKIYGAKQAGMTKVVIPKDNENDVPTGLKGIQVVTVSTIEEALKQLLI